MADAAPDPTLADHCTFAVYPFFHIWAEGWAACLDRVGARWAPWWDRLREDGAVRDGLDATFYFLPYVRSLLFPETDLLDREPSGPGYDGWVRLVREWSAGQHPAHLPAASVLHLTARKELAGPLEKWTLHPPGWAKDRPAEPLDVRLDWLDAWLYPSGVGFLVFKLRLAGPDFRMGRLLHLNHDLRRVRSVFHDTTPATVSFGTTLPRLPVARLIDYLLEGLADTEVAPCADLREFARRLLRGDRLLYTDSREAKTYGTAFHLLSYAQAPELAATGRQPEPPFASRVDRLLFEMASGFTLGQSTEDVYRPGPDQLEGACRQQRLAAWDCWSGLAFRDVVAILAGKVLGKFRVYLENMYLPVYLYALHQRYELYHLSNDLLETVARGWAATPAVRALAERFAVFRQRYWFREVTRKSMGGDLYRTFQAGLGLPVLLEQVEASLKEVRDYHEEQNRQRLGVTQTIWALGIGVVGAAVAALGTFGRSPGMIGLVLGLTALFAVPVVAVQAWAWRRRRTVKALPRQRLPEATPAAEEGETLPMRRAA
jgi:hypothetical protein